MSEKFMQMRSQFSRLATDADKPWAPLLNYLHKKTKVDRLYLATGFLVTISLYLLFGYAAQLLCNFIGLAYPAYISIKAIETSSKEDDTKWLTYWVIYAIFSVVEFFSDFLISWFPFYWFSKCAFLIWLMVPTNYNGSVFAYHQLVRPYFVKHHHKVDKIFEKVSDKIADPMQKLAETLKAD